MAFIAGLLSPYLPGFLLVRYFMIKTEIDLSVFLFERLFRVFLSSF